MRKLLSFFWFVPLLVTLSVARADALERQPNSDYHARREALAKKAAGMVVLFAPMENEGPNNIYGFRQEDNFFYLSGLTEPGSALLIASSVEAKGDTAARAYSEILFLPARHLIQEKGTGPKLGPENPEAAKITGFDRVEEMGKLPDEVTKLATGGHPVIYTDVASHDEGRARAAAVEA